MSRLSHTFPRRHVVLPVIHVASSEQAIRNVSIAHGAGADGVYLINHSISDKALLRIYGEAKEAYPEFWIGVNCLGLMPEEVFQAIPDTTAGVWVDNAMIQEDSDLQQRAETIASVREQRKWGGLYFGGVAFKYQRPVKDLVSAAEIASRYMDVVTTSGPATGQAAAVDKIRTMKDALGDLPLAIASGISPENVRDYLECADCFLVATGISRTFEELDLTCLLALLAEVGQRGGDTGSISSGVGHGLGTDTCQLL